MIANLINKIGDGKHSATGFADENPIGLRNLGNTCYLNCILQAVASCPPFRLYLQKFTARQNAFKSTVKSQFAPALLKCITDIRSSSSKKSVDSSKLFEILSEKKSELAGHDQQDAHELFQVLMSLLVEEAKYLSPLNVLSLRSGASSLGKLPRTINSPSYGSSSSSSSSNSGARAEFRCPLQGTVGSQLICQRCRAPRPIRHQSFLDLSLPIPAVARALSLHDCFQEFLRGEELEQVDCPACTVTHTTSKIQQKVQLMERVASRATATATATATAATQQRQQQLAVSPAETELMKELRSSSFMLKQLSNCCLIGQSDALVMDIDVDDWKRLDLSNNADGRTSRDNEIDPEIDQFDEHLIERIKTSVRKSMYLMQLPEMLCIQINRLLYNPVTDRKMKLPQHIRFGLRLDASAIQSAPQAGPTAAFASTNSSPTTSGTTTGSFSLSDPIDDDIEDVEPLTTTATATISMADSRKIYDLRAVIIHSGSADGGHYTTICKVRNQWYHMSDDSIKEVSEAQLLSCQAYMLFYCLPTAP